MKLVWVWLLLLAPQRVAADDEARPRRKRRRARRQQAAVPAVPAAYDEGACPFHRSGASAKELSAYGHELERDGRQAEALRCYALAVRTSPREETGWIDLAVARQHEEPSLALRLYEHGLSLNPTAFHYDQLGVMLRSASRQEEAVKRFVQAARLAPRDEKPLFNLGGSHEALGRLDEALHAYRGALALDHKTNEARIHNNIGNVLAYQRKWREALLSYHEAEEADEDFPETQQNLANALEALERREEAASQLERAARLLPEQARTLRQRRDELLEQVAKRATDRRQAERREEVNKRDGHLTKEQRQERFSQVIAACGMDKACMRRVLQQEDAKEGDLVVF